MISYISYDNDQGEKFFIPAHAITGVKLYELEGGFRVEIYSTCAACVCRNKTFSSKQEAEEYVNNIFSIMSL